MPGGELAEDYARVNHLYNKALPQMKRLRLTEDGAITLWMDERNRPAIVWAFEDAQMAYTGTVTDLATAKSVQATGKVRFKKGSVYRLSR